MKTEQNGLLAAGLTCPVCREKGRAETLRRAEHAYLCAAGHSFDRAKSGYVNLLLPGDKHSKAPGDNALMVAARRKFLEKGYYRPLALAAGTCLSERLAESPPSGRPLAVLDSGCGEGYYTAQVRHALAEREISVRMFGVDISKIALDKAAKRDRETEFAVASAFHLPFADASLDALAVIFAPFCPGEARRVLRPGGLLLRAVPGARHLWELKKAVYDKPVERETKDGTPEGFEPAGHRHMEYPMELSAGEDIENLFAMTPYYYKTAKEDRDRLLALGSLRVTASFELRLDKKSGGGKE